jgi:hypothetical protein
LKGLILMEKPASFSNCVCLNTDPAKRSSWENEFDRVIPRNGTASLEYGGRLSFFGASDVPPFPARLSTSPVDGAER